MARIRAGPNARENETQFIMKICQKKKNGRNEFAPENANFRDFVERYEEVCVEQFPFHRRCCTCITFYSKFIHTRSLHRNQMNFTHNIMYRTCVSSIDIHLKEKYDERSTQGMRENMFISFYCHGDMQAYKKMMDENEIHKIVKGDQAWIYWGGEKTVHRKGWKDGTKGGSSVRMVEDADVEVMARLLKESKWDFEISSKSDKKMLKAETLDPVIEDKCKLALCVSRVVNELTGQLYSYNHTKLSTYKLTQYHASCLTRLQVKLYTYEVDHTQTYTQCHASSVCVCLHP